MGKFSHRRTLNPKRRLRPAPATDAELARLADLAAKVRYGGNPEHKKNPGDFKLHPPAMARQGKTLCDDVKIFRREVALELLQRGLRAGMISEREIGEWPQIIWCVSDQGHPLEAQREGEGVYHGYPMRAPELDAMREEVISEWKTRHKS